MMNFLAGQGLIKYSNPDICEPKVVKDTGMISVRTVKSGIFEALVQAGDRVAAGRPLANIIHAYDGEIMETLYAPADAYVFFMHNEPLIYANTAVIKLVK